MQEALIAIARYIGLHPWAGKSGGGPVIPGMPDLFTRGTGKKKMRTDVEIGGALYDGLTMVLDFTVVSCMKSGLAEYNEARAGSEDPDRFVRAADLRKATKYAAVCRAAGYAFIPFALSSGGRPSPGALRAQDLCSGEGERRQLVLLGDARSAHLRAAGHRSVRARAGRSARHLRHAARGERPASARCCRSTAVARDGRRSLVLRRVPRLRPALVMESGRRVRVRA